MVSMLKKELEAYQAHRAELLAHSLGKFVLVKDGKVIGVFDTDMDAIRQGYERFGNVPFLVKQVVDVEMPLEFTSKLLAV